jgi:hypothetical protein
LNVIQQGTLVMMWMQRQEAADFDKLDQGWFRERAGVMSTGSISGGSVGADGTPAG